MCLIDYLFYEPNVWGGLEQNIEGNRKHDSDKKKTPESIHTVKWKQKVRSGAALGMHRAIHTDSA